MTLKDDLGRTIRLTRPARRIVSLSPATTENLFAIGAGKFVVGITQACDFPLAAQRLPRVGYFTAPSYEKLLALKPELIVFDSGTVRQTEVESLAARVKAPVFVQRSQKVADIPRHLVELARLTGLRYDARALHRPEPTAKRPVAVFIEVSSSPIYTAGPGSFLDDVVRRAGGRNVVTEGGPFPQLTREKLLTLKPEVYVLPVSDRAGATETPPLLSGVRVVRVPVDWLFRPTPRLFQALDLLTAAFRS